MDYGSHPNIVSLLLSKVGLAPSITINATLGNTEAASVANLYKIRRWAKLDQILDRYRQSDLDLYHLCIGTLEVIEQKPRWVNEWLMAYPNSAHALIVKGAHYINWAFSARGSGTADTVSDKDFELFFDRLIKAETYLARTTEIDRRNPEPYNYLLTTANGLQLERDELIARFNILTQYHPSHLEGHSKMLYALTKKWGGSHKEMYAFAREIVANAPKGSPLASLVALAHIERWLYLYLFVDNTKKANHYIQSNTVVEELITTYEDSITSEKYRKTPLEPKYCGMFAAAFYLANRFDFSLHAFDKMGNVASYYPWCYLDDSPLDHINMGYRISLIKRRVARFVAQKLRHF